MSGFDLVWLITGFATGCILTILFLDRFRNRSSSKSAEMRFLPQLPASSQQTLTDDRLRGFPGWYDLDRSSTTPNAVRNDPRQRQLGARLEVLDELIVEADREIDRLTNLLVEQEVRRQEGPMVVNRPFDRLQRQMVRSLYLAGFTTLAIAHFVHAPVMQIETLIESNGEQSAA